MGFQVATSNLLAPTTREIGGGAGRFLLGMSLNFSHRIFSTFRDPSRRLRAPWLAVQFAGFCCVCCCGLFPFVVLLLLLSLSCVRVARCLALFVLVCHV